MSETTSMSADYTMGYSEEFRQMLNRRSARTHAAYLLPHLSSGQKLLDFGCGPGTISVGLAKAVEPGELHGIDMEESEIELARAAAAGGGHDNATFHVGDVSDLPFEDDTFDVAHCHTVLMHVPDTEATLKEVRRVVKLGGHIASREMIASASFMAPVPESLESAWEVFTKLIAANRGHPQMGRELKARFIEAGFTDIRASASFDEFSTPEDVAFFKHLCRRLVLLARCPGGGHEVRACDPGALRRVAPRHGRVEGPPGRLRVHRLRRVPGDQSMSARGPDRNSWNPALSKGRTGDPLESAFDLSRFRWRGGLGAEMMSSGVQSGLRRSLG